MDFTHAVMLASLFATALVQAIALAIMVKTQREIHALTNRTLLTSETILETAQEVLQRLKNKP